MNVRSLLQAAVVSLVWLGTTVAQNSLLAGDVAGPPTDRAVKSQTVADIVLDREGSLSGALVNSQGKPLAGAEVVVTQGRKLIGKAKTDAKGEFQVKNLRGGVYQLASGKQGAAIRTWSHRTAPPTAKKQALLVKREAIVRAQNLGGFIDPADAVNLGLGVTAVTLSAITLSEINNVEDRVDQISTSP